MSRLVEIAVAGTRLHLFQRGDHASPASEGPQFQHVCPVTGSPAELTGWRQRWFEVYESGQHAFCQSELPTEIVTDDRGCASFCCFDVNGLELELTYLPGGEE